MSHLLKQTQLATAIKRITFCAASTALLATAGLSHALEVKIGGYVKTDVTYDLDQDLGPSLAASSVATGSGTPSDPSFRIHSLQSRFNLSVSEGDKSVKIELDLFGGGGNEVVSNSAHSRLRHAYGKVGNLLIGQTWSTFMDKNWVLYPSTVDFGGPAGATFIRQSQIRWSFDNGLDIALENPENRVSETTTTTVDEVGIDAGVPAVVTKDVTTTDSRGRDTIPDIIVRYAQKGDVSWQVAALLQQFEADGGAADGETESNIGITGGVNFKVGGDSSISVKGNVNSNRYTYYGFENPAAIVDGGNIELIDHTAVVAAFNTNLGGKSNPKITIAYGIITFDDEFLGDDAAEEISTIHANYRWSPYDKVNFGVEVSQASREDVNGDDGDATRLQFGAQFVF